MLRAALVAVVLAATGCGGGAYEVESDGFKTCSTWDRIPIHGSDNPCGALGYGCGPVLVTDESVLCECISFCLP